MWKKGGSGLRVGKQLGNVVQVVGCDRGRSGPRTGKQLGSVVQALAQLLTCPT